MMAVSRELAWRRARGGWRLHGGHLPAERNIRADALSRLKAPDPKAFPMALGEVPQGTLPAMRDFWRLPSM